ncbi:MAG: xanthine dehydrogenase family protein subunit M [Deltaproteobacteria bacterium]|nr:xanthine dehydrogenase family protein subunit M [Deltaproteobacteria bacterium]
MASSRILPEFELLIPQSIKEAVDLLGKLKSKASVMAGGTDVVVSMTKGFGSPNVISLAEIPGLDYVEYDSKNGLRIGAMATLQQVADNADVKKRYPALWKACAINGTPQTRNMGTVVGNIMRASPSGDCICAVLAIGGKVVLRTSKGKREVSIDDFYLKYKVTECKAEELAIEIKLPPQPSGSCNAFARMTRTTLDLSKLNVAVRLDMSGKTCKEARVAMGAVAPTTIRLKKVEALLEGSQITEDVLQKIVETVPTEIKPIDDVRSTAEYRRDVAGVMVKRVIAEALAK